MARRAGPFRGLIVSILLAAVFWIALLTLLLGRGCFDSASSGGAKRVDAGASHARRL